MGSAAWDQWVGLDTASDQEHVRTVWQGLAIFISHPLLGAGIGAYMETQLSTTGTPLVIHSTTVWLLAECGLIGFAVFALAGWQIFSSAFACRQELAARAVIFALAAFGVMAQAHDLLYQRALWLLLGAALAVDALSPLSKRQT